MSDIKPENYPHLLDEKVQLLRQQFGSLLSEEALPDGIAIFASPPLNYRMRAEFRIWHDGDTCHYAMYRQGENNKPYIIDTFPQGSPTITRLMPELLSALNASDDLKRRLFCVEFLTTKTGDALITLIYHRRLDDTWREPAQQLAQQLGCELIGRSRKVKIVIGRDYVLEQLSVADDSYIYQQVETGFTQPNALINEHMLSWAKQQCQQYNFARSARFTRTLLWQRQLYYCSRRRVSKCAGD